MTTAAILGEKTMMTTIRGVLLVGTAVLGVMPVAAQTVAARNAAADPVTDADIIVTAQKRTERLQDVPVTVSVVTGAALRNQSITNITELQNATPELNYVGQPSAGYSIRGSGTQTFTRTSENNVLTVVDGVVQGQLNPPTSSLFDVSRVEVLSGPQGMLFGKNASAGVINIITTAPVLDEFSGRLRASGGNMGYLVTDALVNIPIGAKAALRVTGVHEGRGYTTFNRFNNTGIDSRTTNGVRAKLLVEPVSTLKLTVIADDELERGGNNAWVSVIAAPGSATSIAGRLATCGVTPGTTNTQVCLDGPTSRRILSQGLSFQADADIGGGHTITNIAAYRKYRRDSDTDSDARPINALNNNFAGDNMHQWSEELRLASPSGKRLEYVVGTFFYDYRYRSQVDQSGNLGALPFIATASSTQYITQLSQAVFGQASFKIIDQISLIASGRYTRDTLRGTFIAYTDPTKGIRFSGFGNTPGTASNEVDTNNFSYRLGAQYRPVREVTVFGTYSEGYKGPALNNLLATGIAPPVVRPEYPRNIEAGVKAVLFDRKVNVEVSVFRTDVHDFQSQTTVQANGLTQFVFANASNLSFRGVQVNVYARPATGLNLTGGLLYNEAKYGNFIVQCNAPYLTGCAAAGGAGNVIDVVGRQLSGAPRWKVTAGAAYEQPLTERITGFLDGNLVYRSSAPTSAAPDPNLVIGGYTLIDARVGLRTADGRYSLAAFVKNLTDKHAPTLIFRDPLSPTGNYDQTYQVNAFRTFGVTVDVGF